MARNRLPVSVARSSGADLKNPKRFRGRADPKVDVLGPPPAHLDAAQAQAWRALAAEIPWLRASDRALVEIATRLRVRITEPDCPVTVFAQLRLCMSSLGATPVDRSRIALAAEDEDPGGYLN